MENNRGRAAALRKVIADAVAADPGAQQQTAAGVLVLQKHWCFGPLLQHTFWALPAQLAHLSMRPQMQH
jgi:hypothetical protein